MILMIYALIILVAVIVIAWSVWRRLPPASEYKQGRNEREENIIITRKLK